MGNGAGTGGSRHAMGGIYVPAFGGAPVSLASDFDVPPCWGCNVQILTLQDVLRAARQNFLAIKHAPPIKLAAQMAFSVTKWER